MQLPGYYVAYHRELLPNQPLSSILLPVNRKNRGAAQSLIKATQEKQFTVMVALLQRLL